MKQITTFLLLLMLTLSLVACSSQDGGEAASDGEDNPVINNEQPAGEQGDSPVPDPAADPVTDPDPTQPDSPYDEIRYEVYPDGRVGQQFASMRLGEHWGLMDGAGNVLLEPDKYELDEVWVNTYEENWPLFVVVKDGLKGAIDVHGNLVIEPQWPWLQMFIYEEPERVFVHDGVGWQMIPLSYSSYTDVFHYEGLTAGEPTAEFTVSDGLRMEMDGIGADLTQGA